MQLRAYAHVHIYIDRCRNSHLMYFIVHGHAREVASVCQCRCGLCVWRVGGREGGGVRRVYCVTDEDWICVKSHSKN